MKNKNSIIKRLLTTCILMLLCTFGFAGAVSAQVNIDINTGSDIESPERRNILDTIRHVGDETGLPDFQNDGHANASDKPGLSNITSGLNFITDLAKLILGSIAVVMIIAIGIQFIASGKQAEEVMRKLKKHLFWLVSGLVIVFFADTMVNSLFFGTEGQIFGGDPDTTNAFASRTSGEILAIARFIEIFLAAAAVLIIVVQGVKLVVAGANDDEATKSKKAIGYAAAGLFLVGISEFVVFRIIFPDRGSTGINTGEGILLIKKITNFGASIIGTVAVAIFMYAGYLYVANFGNDEAISKAKKAMGWAVAGMILAAGAFAIASTLLNIDGALIR